MSSVFDINCDTRPDLVVTDGRLPNGFLRGTTPGAGTASPHWNVFLNTGTGFASTPIAWPVRSESYHYAP